MKANFTVTLGRKETMTAVSNMGQTKSGPMWVINRNWESVFVLHTIRLMTVSTHIEAIITFENLFVLDLECPDTSGITLRRQWKCLPIWSPFWCLILSTFQQSRESVMFNFASGLERTLQTSLRTFWTFITFVTQNCTNISYLSLLYIKLTC